MENGISYTYAGKIEQPDQDKPYSLSMSEKVLPSEIISLISETSQKVRKKTINFPNKNTPPDEPENH